MYIVLTLAIGLLVFGIVNAIFHFVTDDAKLQKGTNAVFFLALVLWMWSRKLGKEEAAAARNEDLEAEEARVASVDDSGAEGAIEADGTADGPRDPSAPAATETSSDSEKDANGEKPTDRP